MQLRRPRALAAALFGLSVALTALLAEEHRARASGPLTTESTIIGTSVEGRPLEVGCVGDGDHRVLLVGGIHTGAEVISVDLANEFARRVWLQAFEVPDEITLCLLPALNLDGVESGDHTNANGVDLNRNWPTDDWAPRAYHSNVGTVSGGSRPLSEPETRALYRYIQQSEPDLVIAWHCCGPLVEANDAPRASELAQVYGEAAGYWYLDSWHLYTITGEFLDAMDRLDVPVIDVEMRGDDEIDIAEHMAGVRAVLEALPRE